jgi:hypothetical protein
MTGSRIRALLAATALTSILAYSVSAHGVSLMSHDGMAGAAAGLCLLLVTLLAYPAAPRPQASRFRVVTRAEPVSGDPERGPLIDGRARASPIRLQRFRN